MALPVIDKARYKKRLNWLQGSAVVLLMLSALLFSNLLVSHYGSDGSNLWLNATAVLLSVLLLSLIFAVLKHQPWMADIRYIMQLKQRLNRIYRASKAVDAAVANDQKNGLIVRYFSLHASKYLYQLEDNTLTLEELQQQIDDLDEQIARLQLTIGLDDYSDDILQQVLAGGCDSVTKHVE